MKLSSADLRATTFTVLGEAAGETAEGKAAVAWVILNRLKSGDFGDTARGVALQRNDAGIHQFSTWNTKAYGGNQPTKRYPVTSPEYKSAEWIVARAAAGMIPDPTGGAKFYIVKTLAHPSWFDVVSESGTKVIGNHLFALPRMADVGSNDALAAITKQVAPVPMLKPASIYASAFRDMAALATPGPTDLVKGTMNALSAKQGLVIDPVMNNLTTALQLKAAAMAADKKQPAAVKAAAIAVATKPAVRVVSVLPNGQLAPESYGDALTAVKVTTLRIDPMTNQVITDQTAATFKPDAPKNVTGAKANDRDVVNIPPARVTFTSDGQAHLSAFQQANVDFLASWVTRAAPAAQYGKRDPMSVFYSPAPAPKNSVGAKAEDRDGTAKIVEFGYNARTGNYEAKTAGEPYLTATTVLRPSEVDNAKAQDRLPQAVKKTSSASPIARQVASMVTTPKGYSVPKYVDIVKQVQVPGDQPIAKAEGVHWDSAIGAYVLNDDAPAGPVPTKTVTKTVRVLNPHYDQAAADRAAEAQRAAIGPRPVGVQTRSLVPPTPQANMLDAMRQQQRQQQTAAINASYQRAATLAKVGQLTAQERQQTQQALVATGLHSEAGAAAIAAGQGSYTVAKSQNGVLGENALMPTTTIDGKVRNTYGD